MAAAAAATTTAVSSGAEAVAGGGVGRAMVGDDEGSAAVKVGCSLGSGGLTSGGKRRLDVDRSDEAVGMNKECEAGTRLGRSGLVVGSADVGCWVWCKLGRYWVTSSTEGRSILEGRGSGDCKELI